MINFIKILLQFGSFKIHFMKNQLFFILLGKISENSVHFPKFQDTFTQKNEYRQILRYFSKKIFVNFRKFLRV